MAKPSAPERGEAPSARAGTTRITRSASREPSELPQPRTRRASARTARDTSAIPAASSPPAVDDEVQPLAPVGEDDDENHSDDENGDNGENDADDADDGHDGNGASDVDGESPLDATEATIGAASTLSVPLSRAPRVSSTHSNISGTTAQTSFSQEEIAELDGEVMIDVFDSLVSAADDLAKMILPTDPGQRHHVHKEIRTPGSRLNKLFTIRVASLDLHKQSFGSTRYIQPSIVKRALFGVTRVDHVPRGPWWSDSIIYKVNLAEMLRAVLITLPDKPETETGFEDLEALDASFATAIAKPEFDQASFLLCLSLTTQLCIVRLAVFMTEPNFDAPDVINNAFYDSTEGDDVLFKHADALHLPTASEDDQKKNLALVEKTVSLFLRTAATHSSEPESAVAALRSLFPSGAFAGQATQYYIGRKRELDRQIDDAGGVDEIVSALSREVERRKNADEAHQKRVSLSKARSTPKKDFGRAGIRSLKAMERRLAQSTAPATLEPPRPRTAEIIHEPEREVTPVQDGWVHLEEDDNSRPPSTSPQSRANLSALSGFQQQQQHNAQRARQSRSFIDRQPGAQTVTFEEDEVTQRPNSTEVIDADTRAVSSAPQPRRSQTHPRSSLSKRRINEVEESEESEAFDPTQDDGFQVDARDTATADKRRRHNQTAASSSLQSYLPSRSSGGGGSRSSMVGRMSSSVPIPPPQDRQNPGSTIPPPVAVRSADDNAELPNVDRLQAAKVIARHNTISATRKDMKVQVRKAFTPAEEDALITLIEENCSEGISYATLKALDDAKGEDAILLRRSAEDLRFKARNTKVTFLKSRLALPRNFDYVKLAKRDIDQLERLGVVYHQDRTRGVF